MAKCKGLHGLLFTREFNAHGAVVDCLLCGDTFQIRAETLANRYYHAQAHVSPGGDYRDKDFFILAEMVEETATPPML